jgi:hypothetical protein
MPSSAASILVASVLLLSPSLAGCQPPSRDIENAYQAIVTDYLEGRLDRVYDQIEPETRGMLDACNRGLAVDPQLKSLEGLELFQAMWGKKTRIGLYPMWLFVPGEVTNLEVTGDLAILTVTVDPKSVNAVFRMTTRTVYLVRHEGAWKLSASSFVKSKLRKAGMTK